MENENLLPEEEVSILTLTDENGVDTTFEYLDCIEYEGVEYLVLMPEGDESGEIVILEVEPVDEEMEHSVKDFEPHVALFGGEDGLKFYRIIFERSKYLLKEKSFMAFEMGYNQKENLTALAKEYFPNSKIEVIKDLSGKNRMLFIFNNL